MIFWLMKMWIQFFHRLKLNEKQQLLLQLITNLTSMEFADLMNLLKFNILSSKLVRGTSVITVHILFEVTDKK
jgi:hypothetical protein